MKKWKPFNDFIGDKNKRRYLIIKRPENLQKNAHSHFFKKMDPLGEAILKGLLNNPTMKSLTFQALTGFGFCAANVDHKCGSLVELVGGCVG